MDLIHTWLEMWRGFPFLDAPLIVFIFVAMYKQQSKYTKILFGFILLHWFILNPINQEIISAIIHPTLYWRLPNNIILVKYIFYFLVVYNAIYYILQIIFRDNLLCNKKKIISTFISICLFLYPVQALLNINNLISPSISYDRFSIFKKDKYEGPELIVNVFENPSYLEKEMVYFLEEIQKYLEKRTRVFATNYNRIGRFSRYFMDIELVNYGDDYIYETQCINPDNELVDYDSCQERIDELEYEYIILYRNEFSKNEYYNYLIEKNNIVYQSDNYILLGR